MVKKKRTKAQEDICLAAVVTRAWHWNKELKWGMDPNRISTGLFLAHQYARIDMEKLALSDDDTFIHDVLGTMEDWDTKTLKFNGCFSPKHLRGN